MEETALIWRWLSAFPCGKACAAAPAEPRNATQESLLMQGGLCILQAQSDCTELISRTLPLEAAD